MYHYDHAAGKNGRVLNKNVLHLKIVTLLEIPFIVPYSKAANIIALSLHLSSQGIENPDKAMSSRPILDPLFQGDDNRGLGCHLKARIMNIEQRMMNSEVC